MGRATTHRSLLAAAAAGVLVLAAPLAAGPGASARQQQQQRTVYGADDRRETYGLAGFKAEAARSTVALVDAANLRRDGRYVVLSGPPLAEAEDLCTGQRFARQPTAAFCSGALVGPRLVVTAGHCVAQGDLAATRFVFGYRMLDAQRPATRLPAGDVYAGTAIVARRAGAADYALVRLDRDVAGRRPLAIARRDALVAGLPLFLLGHPSGLPRKYADRASVTDTSHADRFTANLDSFAGNSGSPIFAASSNLLVGILVAGQEDYVPRGSCNVLNQLPDYPGREEATRSTAFAAKVPRGGG